MSAGHRLGSDGAGRIQHYAQMIPCRIRVRRGIGALGKAKRADDRHLVCGKMAPRLFDVDSGWFQKRNFKKSMS